MYVKTLKSSSSTSKRFFEPSTRKRLAKDINNKGEEERKRPNTNQTLRSKKGVTHTQVQYPAL
jgi:hypothetical protein